MTKWDLSQGNVREQHEETNDGPHLVAQLAAGSQ